MSHILKSIIIIIDIINLEEIAKRKKVIKKQNPNLDPSGDLMGGCTFSTFFPTATLPSWKLGQRAELPMTK